MKRLANNRGFVGPLGDDLPSIIAIMLALSLFFAGVVYSLNSYNTKVKTMQALNGALDIARTVTSDGILPYEITDGDALHKRADNVLSSYGLKSYRFGYGLDAKRDCKNQLVFSYLVAKWTDQDNTKTGLAKLVVCVQV